jgi:hypothetical protein
VFHQRIAPQKALERRKSDLVGEYSHGTLTAPFRILDKVALRKPKDVDSQETGNICGCAEFNG